MEFEFTADVIEWRGPAPYYYAVVPEAEGEAIGDLAGALTYGWGCIPVEAWLAGTRFTTSLFPKDGGYVVPLKAAVRPPGLGPATACHGGLEPASHRAPRAIEDRAVAVQQLLAARGQHHGPSVPDLPDLVIAATGELTGRTVLHLGKDFELIAALTGQRVERLAEGA